MDTDVAAVQRPPRKRRLWLWIVLGGLGGLALLAVAAVVGLIAYRDWLIKTYTSSQPQAFSQIEASPAELQQLKTKWDGFWKELSDPRAKPAPLQLSVDELNQFISQIPKLKEHLRLFMEGDKIKGRFSVPLGKQGQAKLNGRYICGIATFDLQFNEGFPTLTVSAVEANSRPIPRWLLKKLQQKNLIEDLDRNVQAKDLIGQLENIEFKDGMLTFVPFASP